MKAVHITQTGPPSVLQYSDSWPKPVRKPGECLVKIAASSVNPVDVKTRAGAMPSLLIAKPKILGGDLAGTVEEADPSSRFNAGDKVYALTNGFLFYMKAGTYAGYMSVPDKHLARIPGKLSFEQAGSLPLVALTALQALRPANIQPGQRVLIHAGSGGVGSVAIQLAKHWKAYVVTTASAANEKFLRDLGADEVVDYKNVRFEERYRQTPFDVVVDTIGGDYNGRSLEVLKPSGYLAHILNQGWAKKHGDLLGAVYEVSAITKGVAKGFLRWGPRYRPVLVQPDGLDLEYITKLVEEGALRPVVDRVFKLEDARESHAYVEEGHVRGKVVLQI